MLTLYGLRNVLKNTVRILLCSSSYNICIGTAISILGYYSYQLYQTEMLFLWNMIGMIIFTLHEYLSHRFILHFYNDGIIYHYLHGNHHFKPLSKSIHTPILFTSIVNILYFYLGCYISFKHSINIMTGYQISYIIFEHIHKEIHHPTLFLNDDTFRLFHMYHHMRSKHKAFSFSVPLWDIIFGTFPNDILIYNWFAFIPIPFISFKYGTYKIK